MEMWIVKRNQVKKELTWKEEITDMLHYKEEENLFLNLGDRRPCKEQATISHIFLKQRVCDNYMKLYVRYRLWSKKKKNVTLALEYFLSF